MKRFGFTLVAVMLLAGCTTTASLTSTLPAETDRALVDVDKALIVADAAYISAAHLALAGVRSGLLTGETRLAVGHLSDVAEAALHQAYQVRSAASIATAVAAIAAFAAAAKGGT